MQPLTLFGMTLEFSVFSLISLFCFIALVQKVLNSKYYIGDSYVRSVHGRLSFQRKDIRIDFVNIKGIEINASLYDRIFNIGTVLIGSSTGGGIYVSFEKVKNPGRIRNLIESQMQQRINQSS